ALVHIQWPDAGGTQSVSVTPPGSSAINQSDFSSANNLALVPQLSGPQEIAFALVGSSSDPFVALTPGVYQVTLTSDIMFSSDPTLHASFGDALPTVAVGTLPPDPDRQQVPVMLSGQVATSLADGAKVAVFVDDDTTGFDGTPIPGG